MSTESINTNASWINPALYPYTAQTLQVPAGRLRYLDEGQGQPVLMVHGNPSWSIVYRKLVDGLSDTYRCVAPDHIGFGQSDKPTDWTYLPQDHAANLARLVEALDLADITLVVQDWGGPIGLSFAIAQPERISRLVILNTWLWDVRDDWYYRAFSSMMGGPFGRWLSRNFNGFARFVVPRAYGVRSRLSKELHRHYLHALPDRFSREGSWIFPRQITHAGDWLNEQWEGRAALTEKPTLIAWGMKDIAFREKELRRWVAAMPHAQVHRFETVGHYVQEEAGEDLVMLMRAFIAANP